MQNSRYFHNNPCNTQLLYFNIYQKFNHSVSFSVTRGKHEIILEINFLKNHQFKSPTVFQWVIY